MGRAAVLVLALANLGYLAWHTGALAVFDLVPADLSATEPQRLARQILPGRLRVVTPQQVQEEAEARARARAEAEAQARTQEIRTTASATLAGSDTVIAESEPVVLSVLPAPPGPPAPSDRSASPPPSMPPASAASASPSASASARASGSSRPAAAPR